MILRKGHEITQDLVLEVYKVIQYLNLFIRHVLFINELVFNCCGCLHQCSCPEKNLFIQLSILPSMDLTERARELFNAVGAHYEATGKADYHIKTWSPDVHLILRLKINPEKAVHLAFLHPGSNEQLARVYGRLVNYESLMAGLAKSEPVLMPGRQYKSLPALKEADVPYDADNLVEMLDQDIMNTA